MMGATHHAVEALALFYPRATEADVLAEVSRGIPIEAATAVRLVGRERARPGSDYVLHRERTGLFVLAGRTVVTFLRFYAKAQHTLAVQLWGEGCEPTAQALWNRAEVTPVPDASPLPVKASSGVVQATGLNRPALRTLALDVMGSGALEPPGDYAHSYGLTGVFRVGETVVGVCVGSDRIHLVIPTPSAAAMRKASKALGKEKRQAEGVKQAAALLRRHGWTCTPPNGEEP